MTPSSFEDRTPPISGVTQTPTCSWVPPIGSWLADGRYEVMEVLGEGGMSTVLGAFDHEIERPVAIKILHDVGGERALLDEARMMGAAQSSEVVAVFALHLDASPPFLVMERVHGTALDELLRRRPPTFEEGMRLLAQIAHALDGLHARGIVHGDVKAGNVLVMREGGIKLADLGITPLLRRAAQGDVVGTPAYMPPERARGLVVSEDLHARGDVYSFAVLAFAVLTGRAPFVASSPHDLLRAHASEPPPPMSGVSELAPALDAALAPGLEKDPHARPKSAGELMRALERAARGVDASGRSARILVVDDDEAHRELHRCVLERELPGAIVDTAESAAATLAKLPGSMPSVLVVDLAMPGTSGLALLEQLHARAPHVRAVVVTGLGSGKEREAASAIGVKHFLIKPVAPSELTRCVTECIERDDTAAA
jgi:serine/threonine protein kinase